MARKYQKEECAGCANELSELDRKRLQQAIRRGFRCEGKAPLKKRESDEVDSCPVCEWPIVSDRWAAMMTRAEQEWESRDGR